MVFPYIVYREGAFVAGFTELTAALAYAEQCSGYPVNRSLELKVENKGVPVCYYRNSRVFNQSNEPLRKV